MTPLAEHDLAEHEPLPTVHSAPSADTPSADTPSTDTPFADTPGPAAAPAPDPVDDVSPPSTSAPPSEAPSFGAVVKGRIKVAALAALEVTGVADLGGDLARAFESVRDRIGIGSRRANQGVSAQIQDHTVAVSVTIVVEYGHVVMEVASEVKTNVARNVSHMLGMRVAEVNVTVDDVRLPGEPRRPLRDTSPDDTLPSPL
ncbi:Asp23/Gls24 family envelope stress response protein [Nonomuraea angiospora]|uniref:Alkaline shock family protein YloU n=1 Tax=Nonomuraea angiospora TaxID=46172 RepID=A0ABR9LWK5_9ACTN|nr:Asp23/Gls24 family envelope stress response protein [Nonomuraea angiospora]MBE1585035.1 putative alkaline shock family protein YloU [Nonomuraea angiospora]